ncbi:cell cycle regulator of non-homologous end joining isoform X5 [Canis lupus dingo]|uniref:Cell cycle regulator of NHEJ n=1 Tax=Canis lupus familiaris TaxID=9615 RepID=A0A8C0MTQ0_CANLF|nr:cell cycle regulator of non-homologous end joining isoform X5 [Canis lupus dingo]
MEAVKSGDKKRVLPAWMTTQETPKPKRAVQGAAAARLPAMRTAYCMSEAEMVDVALGILIEARKQEEPWESVTPAGADKPELFPARLAWAPSSPGSRSEDEDNGKEAPTQGLSPQQGPAGPDSACRSSPDQDEDEDMLKTSLNWPLQQSSAYL